MCCGVGWLGYSLGFAACMLLLFDRLVGCWFGGWGGFVDYFVGDYCEFCAVGLLAKCFAVDYYVLWCCLVFGCADCLLLLGFFGDFRVGLDLGVLCVVEFVLEFVCCVS